MKERGQTEKEIIRAALELFVTKGYHNTSIDEITKRVGFSKGALYAHFKSKGDLLHRLIEEFRSHWAEDLLRVVDESKGNAVDKLHQIISIDAKFAIENESLSVFLTFLTTELKSDIRFEPALKSLYRAFHKVITKIVEQGIREGVFRKDLSPELVAFIYLAMHDGLIHQWILNRNYIDGRQYIRSFRRILIDGLCSHPAGNAVGSESKGV